MRSSSYNIHQLKSKVCFAWHSRSIGKLIISLWVVRPLSLWPRRIDEQKLQHPPTVMNALPMVIIERLPLLLLLPFVLFVALDPHLDATMLSETMMEFTSVRVFLSNYFLFFCSFPFRFALLAVRGYWIVTLAAADVCSCAWACAIQSIGVNKFVMKLIN